MVRQFTPNCEALARTSLEPKRVEDIPVEELGECLVYLSSVPRRVVMVVNICAFDWQPGRVLRSELSPADIEPVLQPTLAG